MRCAFSYKRGISCQFRRAGKYESVDGDPCEGPSFHVGDLWFTKKSAMKFIGEEEKFDRNFYCGFLGPVNFDDELHLYVNIRCMQLLEDIAVVYTGAGITQDSDPVCEWEETNTKCQMMLNALESFI
jgi:hypothetical protein